MKRNGNWCLAAVLTRQSSFQICRMETIGREETRLCSYYGKRSCVKDLIFTVCVERERERERENARGYLLWTECVSPKFLC